MTKITEDTTIDAKATDGNVSITTSGNGERATLYLTEAARVPPLSMEQTHAVLKIHSDTTDIRVDLDGRELDALRDAIHRVDQEILEHQ